MSDALSFGAISESYLRYLKRYDLLNKTMAERDFMAGDNYFDVGKSAAECIVSALISAGHPPPKRILDLACGNGRVTRHLSLLFPAAEITACDLYPEMVDFCSSTFGAKGVVSCEDLAQLKFDNNFDLIWCGSLLTHCDAPLFRAGFNTIAAALATPGLAVVTVHGRRVTALQRYIWKMCPDRQFRSAERAFNKDGFGFIDTYDEVALEHFPLNAGLGGGHSLSSAAYVCDLITENDDLRLISYREMGWNGHQDVVSFGTPGVYVGCE